MKFQLCLRPESIFGPYGTVILKHPVLELNRTDDLTSTAFLDLKIFLEKEKLNYTTYDKTRDFKFIVIKYPKFDSCLPRNMISNILLTEIIRFSRTNNTFDGFNNNIELLFKIFRDNGCPEKFLVKGIDRIISNKNI